MEALFAPLTLFLLAILSLTLLLWEILSTKSLPPVMYPTPSSPTALVRVRGQKLGLVRHSYTNRAEDSWQEDLPLKVLSPLAATVSRRRTAVTPTMLVLPVIVNFSQ